LPITRRGNAVVSVVADLIIPVTGSWDEDLVTEIFRLVDANLILSIPLRDGMEDFYAWFYDPKGVFSVKAAYKLHCQLLQLNSNEPTGEPSSLENAFN
jgi:hypothetical protein